MRSLSGGTITALSAPTVPLVQLVLMSFATPIALNTSNIPVTFGGVTYLGAGALGSITQVDDSPGEVKGIQFTLTGVSSAYISLALDDAAVVQGTPVTIRTAVLDANYAVSDAPIEWTGTLDTMSIQEDGDTCTIQVTAESTAVDLLKGSALTYSDADQQSLHPGDLAFQYVNSQSETPVVWPSRAWFINRGPQ